MKVFIFSEFRDERITYIIKIKICNQFNVSVSTMKSFYSFAKIMKTLCAYFGIADNMLTFYCEI